MLGVVVDEPVANTEFVTAVELAQTTFREVTIGYLSYQSAKCGTYCVFVCA